MDWHSEKMPVAPAYIQINITSDWQMIIPADRFRGISASKNGNKVSVVMYGPNGESFFESYDITPEEYERIAIQLGFMVWKEDER